MSSLVANVSGMRDEDGTVATLPVERPMTQLSDGAPGAQMVAPSGDGLTMNKKYAAKSSPLLPTQLGADGLLVASNTGPEPEGVTSTNHLRVFGTRPQGTIGRDRPRTIVRIERDYTSGEVVQFFGGWMWEFEGRISPRQYESIIKDVNEVLASAHDPSKSFWDNVVAVLTLYISPKVFGSHYERASATEMARFQQVLQKANTEVLNSAGINILSPRRNGFLYLEFEYY
ncbi:hypothetical protein OIV83_000114 [Microbotryomycetes sp. JL201]|nr:hypothetical protein OIV83_000114 [Microbotryomycetes sp. JL201]